MKLAKLTGIGLLCGLLAGCPMVDSQMLSGTREYFPNAVIYKPRPDVMHIETNVGGVTKQFGKEFFDAMWRQRGQSMMQGLQWGNYRFLIIGFNEFNIVFDRAVPYQYQILDAREFGWWSQRTFGYTLSYPAGAPAPGVGLPPSVSCEQLETMIAQCPLSSGVSAGRRPGDCEAIQWALDKTPPISSAANYRSALRRMAEDGGCRLD